MAYDAGDAGADERAQRHAQRIARRLLDGRRGAGGRSARQRLSARRQRHVRHHARPPDGFPNKGDFGNAFLKIVDRRRPGGGRLLRDVRHGGASPTPTPTSDPAARWSCRISSTRRARRGTWPSAPARTGTSTSSIATRWASGTRRTQPELPGHHRRARRRRCSRCRRTSTARCTTAGLERHAESVRDRQRARVGHAASSSARVVRLSGDDAGDLGVRHRPAASSGRWRIRAPRCCTPTTRRI